MVDTPEESLPLDRDLITDSDALVELMMLDSDEEMEDDVTNVANFNATRLANRKYKNKDRPNYFLCFKVFLLSLIIYSIQYNLVSRTPGDLIQYNLVSRTPGDLIQYNLVSITPGDLI